MGSKSGKARKSAKRRTPDKASTAGVTTKQGSSAVSGAELLQRGEFGPVLEWLRAGFRAGRLHFGVAMGYLETAVLTGRFELAEQLVRECHEQFPGRAECWRLEFHYQRHARDWHGCLRALEECRRLGDWDDQMQMAYANYLERSSRPAEALEALDRDWPDEMLNRIWSVRARAWKGLGEYTALLEQLWPWLEQREGRDWQLAECWSIVGQGLDRLGRYDEAFGCFRRSNAMAEALSGGDISTNQMRQHVETMRSLVTADWVAQWRPVAPSSRTPVFLVGFPRSGTTLLEQVLDAHPGIQAMEERATVDRIRNAAWFMTGTRLKLAGKMRSDLPWKTERVLMYSELARLGEQEVEKLRSEYFHEVERWLDLSPESVLVDKLPLNLTHIPLILRVFPNARFVVALRHPCNCVLSGYMQSFENNPAMANLTSIEHGATFYRHVMDLLEQCRQAFSLDSQMHYIRYEDLVTDFEPEVRRLLDFLGLEWDPAVSRYHEHAQKRVLATPSYQGVTRQLYTSALERWRNYRPWMEPVFPELQDACRRYGYNLDP